MAKKLVRKDLTDALIPNFGVGCRLGLFMIVTVLHVLTSSGVPHLDLVISRLSLRIMFV